VAAKPFSASNSRTIKALSTLSQKTATVFGDSRTFLRQCGQGLRLKLESQSLMLLNYFRQVVHTVTLFYLCHSYMYVVTASHKWGVVYRP